MEILSYKRNGKDIDHDVSYSNEGNICRFGSDEEQNTGMIKAMGDVAIIARRISGLIMKVNKIGFSKKGLETTIAIEGVASVADGSGDMKIVLPKVGWRETTRQIEDHYEKVEIPAGIEEADILVFQALMAALELYVQNGAGQMDFGFTE